MTCGTCKGRGVYEAHVAEFSYVPGEPARNMTMKDGGKQLVPCPDCTPKPFASVVKSDLHGEPVLSWPGGTFDPQGWSSADVSDVASLRNAARRISEAVAQREVKLRARIGQLREALDDCCTYGHHDTCPTLVGGGECDCGFVGADMRVRESDEIEAVTGDVACGMAFDLGATEWTQVVLQRAAEGLADARSIEVRPFLAAVTGNRPPMEAFSDDELSAEIERRIEVRLRDEERERANELLAQQGEWAHMCLVRDVMVVTPLPQVCMHCRQMPPLTALRASVPRT